MKKIFLIISLLIIQTNLLAQKSYVSASDMAEIDQQLDSHFGVDYEIGDAIFVDSLENHYDLNRSGIDDEYGTLDNCIVFTASQYEGYRSINRTIGVYRANQVIWYSENIVDEDILGGGFIDMIEDINNDGKVEILTIWESEGGANYHTKKLYVHSWDGTQGILAVDVSGGGSHISCHENKLFKYIDVNGDGKFEIISFAYTDNFPTVFEWDGTKYTYSETEQLDSTEMFFPRNNFIPIVSTRVGKSEDKFIYNYKVENSSGSAQSINEFDVYGFDIDYNISNNYYFNVLSPLKWQGDDRRNCATWVGYPIKPSNNLSGFSYNANGLPHIGYAYLRAYNYQWTGDYRENTSVKDYLNNSVIIKTVAAKLPPSPFSPQEFLDSLINYNNQSYQLGWIANQATADKYDSLFNVAKTQFQQNNNNAARTTLQTVLQEVDIDSTANLTSEAYALLRYNTEYLLEQIPQSSPNLLVTLTNSQGTRIPASNVNYYDTSWQDAIDNGDGTFTVITTKPTVSVRMFYEGANQTVNNVPAQNNTYTFQTINVAVQLQNSMGSLIDEGTVQYYAGAWRSFGTTVNGVANKELLPKNYSFRMTYEYGSIDKQQDISVDPTVVFQTVNAAVELRNSSGNLIDEGTVQYYAGAWREFGTTINGVANKELLPKNYSFRMTYEYVSNDKQQDLSTNSTVTFSTVLCTLKVTNANNQPLEGADTKYYSGAWRDIGLTNANGEITKELLPKNLSFRAIYGSVSQDKQQDIGVNGLVEIQLNTQ